MLIHADVKGLEVVTAAYLSRDKTLMEEVLSQKDFHADNQKLLQLPPGPDGRRMAKIFIFKLIYGGTDYGYSIDPLFNHLSTSKAYWTKRIEEFYEKYSGMHKWHEELVRTVINSGRLVMPTGREYHFPVRDVINRQWYWKPKILNYPVQGTGADLVCIGRVTAWKRLRRNGASVLWQSTVHDSIDLDVLDKEPKVWYNVCKIVNESIMDVPTNFFRLFGVKFDLPINAEIKVGPNLQDMELYVPANHST